MTRIVAWVLVAFAGVACAQPADPALPPGARAGADAEKSSPANGAGQAQDQPAVVSAPLSWRGDTKLPPEIVARLSAISPIDPEALLRAGEDLSSMGSPLSIRVARRVLAGAIEIDRQRGGGRVGAGACLLLAEIATTEPDRRWFAALARALESGASSRSWLHDGDQSYNADAAYNAACAVGLVRAGDGLAARQLFKEPGVRDILLDHERLLSTIGEPGGLAFLEREAAKWPCTECRNDRVVKVVVNREVQHKLCPICGGNPGPVLSDEAVILQLRLEARLLRGVQRSWAAQLAADRGMPLDDPDPDELSKVLGFDSLAFVFKGDGWYRVDGTQPPPPSPIAAPTPVPDDVPAQPKPPADTASKPEQASG